MPSKRSRGSRIDILINCAARKIHSQLVRDSARAWHEQYQFSTLYAVQLIRALVRASAIAGGAVS